MDVLALQQAKASAAKTYLKRTRSLVRHSRPLVAQALPAVMSSPPTRLAGSASLIDTLADTYTDGVLNSTTTVTSATAAFTSADVGALIQGTGIPNNSVINSVTNSTTVVISHAATATATGVTIYVSRRVLSLPYNTTQITRLGQIESDVVSSSITYQQNNANNLNSSVYAIEFDLSCPASGTDAFSIGYHRTNANTVGFWVWVDGQPATAASEAVASGSSSAQWFFAVKGLGVGQHRIRVYMAQADFGTLHYKKGAQVIATPKTQPVHAVLGDSWTQGTGGTTNIDGFPTWLGALLGHEIYNAGQGGTGYMNPNVNPKTAFTDTARLAKIVTANPDVVTILGSVNDDNNGYTSAQITAAVQTVLTYLTTNLPNARIFVFGPQELDSNNAVQTGHAANIAAVQAGVTAQANSNVTFIDLTAAMLSYGTGATNNLIGDGNADYFADGPTGHPSNAYHKYLACYVAQQECLALAA